jgi:hypothetical protein
MTKIAPSFRTRAAARGNSRNTPRPHNTSYFPFAARTDIFFIRLLCCRMITFKQHSTGAQKM